MRKTKWKIGDTLIQVFPNRAYLLSGILVLFILGVIWTYIAKGSPALMASLAQGYVFVLIVAGFFFANAATVYVFDANAKKVTSKWAGILTLKTISFDDIAVIDAVTGTYGLTYAIFKKSNRHGKGIRISSYYKGFDDKTAISFEAELLPALAKMVFGNQPATSAQPVPIGTFEFYKPEGEVYLMKQNKIFTAVIMLVCLVWWYYAFTTPGYAPGRSPVREFIAVWFPLVLALVFAFMLTSSWQFDKQRRVIVSKSLGGLTKKEINFDDFVRYNIVRRSTNFIYTGTSVNLVFNTADGKQREFAIRTFMNTNKIQRFLDETAEIMGVKG
ncbi:hypothetical protein [Chitinophaga sp. sic0106]|uniref:hypothetical protein n=1 Tax=Chitinophaga sp. sic0106 TaxID=2854785 RepID=UPI001C47B966|nr:hypothetical protein [Chitinophaga sp. sic0106]MBV7530722.1 hypothetical protein [Chitinophaga sp. sic0106]